jgi:hypothetical protein
MTHFACVVVAAWTSAIARKSFQGLKLLTTRAL